MAENYEDERQKKVDSFKLNIQDEDYIPAEKYEDKIKSGHQAQNERPETEELSDYTMELDEKTQVIDALTDKKIDDCDDIKEKTKIKDTKWYDKFKKRKKSAKYGCLFKMIWLVAVITVGIIISQIALVGINDLLAIKRTDESVVSISIPKDATIDQISQILLDNGVINNTKFFKFYAKMTKATDGYNQGTFELRKNMDYEAIINALQSTQSRTDIVTIRFTEGMSIMEYADLLEKNQICTKNEFLECCNSDIFDEDYPFIAAINNSSDRYYKLEGYLFPDTYNFYQNSTPESVIRRLLANFRNKIYSNKYRFEGYDKKMTIAAMADNLNISIDDVINIASIIQAEAANENDMYNISSVIHNRLSTISNGGVSPYGDGGLNKLQSDATLYYPYPSEDDVPENMVGFVSKYNTYNVEGLPAGAICNPSMAAILATLEPNDTNYYFFCHSKATDDSTAKAYYASTLYYHNINLREAGLL